jgi:PAS domain S-box-containing protein
MTKRKLTLDLGNLRNRAEEQVRERKLAGRAPQPDLERLVHELEVQQVALELQNEELREARVDLESALARYTEIFDFAPIGYATISLDSTLHEVNHAAAKLFGSSRSHLLRRRFDSFVVPSDRARFSELLRQVVESEARESCELQLFRVGAEVVEVKLLARLLARSEPLILIALDDRPARGAVSEPVPTESGVMSAVRPPDVAGRR